MDTDLTLLVLVTGTCLAVLGWAGRKRFPLRIGVGNFFRRKTQVAIVVAGLLIGTAIITSSFVIQTTFDSTIRSAVLRALDFVDETIFVASPDGSRLPFNVSVYDALAATLPTWTRATSRPTCTKRSATGRAPFSTLKSSTSSTCHMSGVARPTRPPTPACWQRRTAASSGPIRTWR